MIHEEEIKQKLINRFAYLEGNCKVTRPRRVFAEVSPENFLEVFDYLAKGLNFTHLCTITGLDESDKLSFIYHLAEDSGLLVNLKTSVPKERPLLKTVTPYFPGAEIYERELIDLLGAEVEGLPAGNRYPLTDDWPQGQYPLRKDWKPDLDKGSEGCQNA